jgi:catechol 2,3-dioxygenase-like lactoylglutathione lyase family enzyme
VLSRLPVFTDVDAGVAYENWRLQPMAHVRRFDHVGITVANLDRATAFFVELGLEVEGRMFMDGEFVDTVIGIADPRSEIVMLRPPDGGAGGAVERRPTGLMPCGRSVEVRALAGLLAVLPGAAPLPLAPAVFGAATG